MTSKNIFLQIFYFLSLFISFVFCNNDAEDYYNTQTIIIAVFLFLVGIVFTFLGYRLFNFTILLLGFVSCGLFSYLFLEETTNVEWYFILAFAVVIGIVGAVLCYCLKYIAMFALGFCAGLVIALMASGIIDTYVSSSTANETWFVVVMWLSAILLGIICGIIVILVQRILFILLTSVLGSYLAVASIDYITGDGTFSAVIKNAIEGTQNELNSWIPVVMFCSWIILALLGMIIQFAVTAKGFSHRRKKSTIGTNINNGETFQIVVNK